MSQIQHLQTGDWYRTVLGDVRKVVTVEPFTARAVRVTSIQVSSGDMKTETALLDDDVVILTTEGLRRQLVIERDNRDRAHRALGVSERIASAVEDELEARQAVKA